jgi:hypothetical protein
MQIAIGLRLETVGFEDTPAGPATPDNTLLLALNLAAPGSALPLPESPPDADQLAVLLNAYDFA